MIQTIPATLLQCLLTANYPILPIPPLPSLHSEHLPLLLLTQHFATSNADALSMVSLSFGCPSYIGLEIKESQIFLETMQYDEENS